MRKPSAVSLLDLDVELNEVCDFIMFLFASIPFFVVVSWGRLATWSQDTLALSPDPDFRPHLDDRLALHPDDEPWSHFKPRHTIEYHDCYDGLKCARLLLPLRFAQKGSKEPEIAVALIRKPSRVNITDSRYGGVVIVNPGGPGASGVRFLLENGGRLQQIIDADTDPEVGPPNTRPDARYFDIISFDPRGVNHTSPQFNCFPYTSSRHVWSYMADAEGFIGSSNTSFEQKWSRYLSRSATCMQRVEEEGHDSIAYYMGTRSVADDVVAIAESHGQWREAEARKILKEDPTATQLVGPERAFASTKWRRNNEEVLFWGVSYGAVLGSTVAALNPGRVRRMVLDSTVSPQYHFNGTLGDTLTHADEILAQFLHLCRKYGPTRCKFYRETEDAMHRDMSSVISRLKHAPLAVPASLHRGPDSITWTDMMRLVGQSLYHPASSFPLLAEILQDIFNGNGTSFANHKATKRGLSVEDAQEGLYNLSPKCKLDGPYSPACSRPNEWLEESLLGISCGDGGFGGNMTQDQFRPYYDLVKAQSTANGDIWAEWDMMCAGWTAKTKWKFEGPFQGDTAHPILFVGNRLDPVCPVEDAHRLSSNYTGSVVLTQNTIGHGILSAHSICTDMAIKAYFQTGELPASGATCEVEHEPLEIAYD
ncbi:hypothetical protein K491DRAFT_621285, partial [Lophiostoma macrostomum CBS 122681]